MLTEAHVTVHLKCSEDDKCSRSIVDRFRRVHHTTSTFLSCPFVSVQIVKLLLGENSKAAEGAACSSVILQQLCPLYLGMAALNIWSWGMGSEIRPKVSHQKPIGVGQLLACVLARKLQQYCPPCASPCVPLPLNVEPTASAIVIFSQGADT